MGRQTACNRVNNQSAPNTEVISKPSSHLLDAIRATRENVGDVLNDDELTRLLRQTGLPTEAGFAFLSFSDGFVTMTVPQQDPANWYPEKGWIVAAKEKIARAIAERYELSLWEPPDIASGFLFPHSESQSIHHHLQLSNRSETVIVAHPNYLKVRMFGMWSGSRSVSGAKGLLLLGPDFLQDLAALYQA